MDYGLSSYGSWAFERLNLENGGAAGFLVKTLSGGMPDLYNANRVEESEDEWDEWGLGPDSWVERWILKIGEMMVGKVTVHVGAAEPGWEVEHGTRVLRLSDLLPTCIGQRPAQSKPRPMGRLLEGRESSVLFSIALDVSFFSARWASSHD